MKQNRDSDLRIPLLWAQKNYLSDVFACQICQLFSCQITYNRALNRFRLTNEERRPSLALCIILVHFPIPFIRSFRSAAPIQFALAMGERPFTSLPHSRSQVPESSSRFPLNVIRIAECGTLLYIRPRAAEESAARCHSRRIAFISAARNNLRLRHSHAASLLLFVGAQETHLQCHPDAQQNGRSLITCAVWESVVLRGSLSRALLGHSSAVQLMGRYKSEDGHFSLKGPCGGRGPLRLVLEASRTEVVLLRARDRLKDGYRQVLLGFESNQIVIITKVIAVYFICYANNF